MFIQFLCGICENVHKYLQHRERIVWSHYELQKWVALGWIIPERYWPKSRNFMEASRKKQSRVRGQSCVSPECTTPDKVSVKSVKMISIYNILNNVTLDTLKVNLRNRVVFGGQYKIQHTLHQSSSEALCAFHR